MLRELGAEVIESDELGRALMEPGQPPSRQIVRVSARKSSCPTAASTAHGLLNWHSQGGRVKELNAIVHPAVIDAQRRWMDQVFARDPAAVAVVVSALIFEVERDARAGGEPGRMLHRSPRAHRPHHPRHRARRSKDRPLRRPIAPGATTATPPKPMRAPASHIRFPTAKKPLAPIT